MLGVSSRQIWHKGKVVVPITLLLVWLYCTEVNPVAVVVVPYDQCERMVVPVSQTFWGMGGAARVECEDPEAIEKYDPTRCYP